MSIKLLYGENSFLKQRAINELVNRHIQQHGEESVEKLQAQDLELDNLRSQLSAGTLFASERLVFISGAFKQKELSQEIIKIYDQGMLGVELVLLEEEVDKRTKFFHWIKKNGQIIEYKNKKLPELTSWVREEAERLGGKITDQSAKLLVERLGNNQHLIFNELVKLIDYNKNITNQTIAELVEPTPQEKIFDLLDAIVSGDHRVAIELYRQIRKANYDPFYVLSMISWQLFNMILVKSAKGKSAQMIASQARMSPFVVSKTASINNKLSLKQISKMIELAADADLKLKTTSAPEDSVLESLILEITEIV